MYVQVIHIFTYNLCGNNHHNHTNVYQLNGLLFGVAIYVYFAIVDEVGENNIIADIRAYSIQQLNKLPVKRLRSLIPHLMMVCYRPEEEWQQKEKCTPTVYWEYKY